MNISSFSFVLSCC